jgi:hypothetical protein
VRNHVTHEINGVAPDFDVATEFWLADGAAVQTVMEVLEGPAGEEIRADEKSFMDRERNVSLPVTERVVAGPGRNADLGASVKVAAFARRPQGGDRRAFLEAYERGPLARLLNEAKPLRCTQNEALTGLGGEPPFDCVTMLWYPAQAGWPAPLCAWAPDAGRLLLLGVTEHETAAEQLRGPG